MRKLFFCVGFMIYGFLLNAQTSQTCTTCATTSIIDNCAITSMSKVSDFNNGSLYYTQGCPDGLCAGSVWRFRNITNTGSSPINATITIDALTNATLEKLDDDAAVDQNSGTKASLFAPAIKPDITLNGTDRKGYVQFTIRFFLGDVGDGYSLLLNLSNLSVYEYDLDGDNAGNVNVGTPGSWFKETGYLKLKETDNPQIQLDANTEINPSNFLEGIEQWVGGTSSLCSKTGLTACGQNTIAGKFSKPQYAITIRLGYDYNAGGNLGQPAIQHGIKLGCFNIPGSVQLPVNLYEFIAKRIDNNVKLEWATTYEQMNQGFRVQRKTDGANFEDIDFIPSQAPGGNSQIKLTYHYSDNNNYKGVSQYRIVQTDLENKIRVSEVRSVAGESAKGGMVIYPNPSADGRVSVIFENTVFKHDAMLVNVFGQRIRQWTNITSNTLAIDILTPGFYTLLITDPETGNIQSGKFAVAK